MTDGTGATSYQYDSLHRLTNRTDGAGNQVVYAYDLRGGLTGLTYPSGKQVTRVFDGAGRMSSLQDWLGNTSHFQYDADGNLVTTTYGNGVAGAFGYDQDDRVITMNYSHSSQSFLALNYTRNGLGQVTAAAGPGTTTYAYDSINQLNAENQSALAYKYAQDITQLITRPSHTTSPMKC